MPPEKEDKLAIIEEKIHRSACFQRIFGDPEGRKVLDYIDIHAGYKNNTFTPDPYTHAFNAGARAVSVFIHTVLDEDVERATKRLTQEKENAGE